MIDPKDLRETAEAVPHDVYTWLHPKLMEAAAEIERLRALLKEAADHIDGTTGARDRPTSDSGELVARIDAAIERPRERAMQELADQAQALDLGYGQRAKE